MKITKEGKVGNLVGSVMNNLKLPLGTQIAIALSLYLSDRSELVSLGEGELIQRLKEYSSCDKPVKLPERLLDELLFQININL
jgi:hypothetical protein